MSSKNGLPPIHPGEFLKEALEELGTSQAEFARAIGISPMRISHVVNGTRPVTAELALLFGRAFGQTPQYWLNLQSDYDLKTAQQEIGSRLRAVRPLAHAGGPCRCRLRRRSELRAHLAGAFAKWQLRGRVQFLDAIPRTSTG